ncbi:MAG: alanine racemase [Candidatus Ancillula sp.]|jgi:alanine racemase|nr:alanine racemase [Candidatus Ancillula sp.]
MNPFPARIEVNLEAITRNTEIVCQIVNQQSKVEVMGIVKADAYGHGLIKSAKAIIQGGATWLGVAKISEALKLRRELDEEGLHPRILTWIYTPDADLRHAILSDLTLSISANWALDLIIKAVKTLHKEGLEIIPKIHIKVDTGFGRNGFGIPSEQYSEALKSIAKCEQDKILKCDGIWSHLARADEPNNQEAKEVTKKQKEVFDTAINIAKEYNLDPYYKHISASAGILGYPDMYYNLVRPGIILYGLSPNPDEIHEKDLLDNLGLHITMKLEGQLTSVKDMLKGSGISYGHIYHTKSDTKIGIVPLGYADGVMRACSGSDEKPGAQVAVFEKTEDDKNRSINICNIAGKVCMDQFMIDLGAESKAQPGDWVTLFDDDVNSGLPLVDDWAKSAGTINYEILTKLSPEIPRIYN